MNWQTNSQPGAKQQKKAKLISPKNVKSQKSSSWVNLHCHSLVSWLLPIPWLFYHPHGRYVDFLGVNHAVSLGTKTERSSRDDSVHRSFCGGNMIQTSPGLLPLCTVFPHYPQRPSAMKHPCMPICHHLWPLQLWKILILPWWESDYSN